MKVLWKFTASVCLFSLSMTAGPVVMAQQAGSTQASAPSDSKPAEAASLKPADASTPTAPLKIVLKEGTPVSLKFAQKLSSKTAKVGDPVELILDEELLVGQTPVAKKGAKATATVSQAKKAGMAGRGGELNIQLEYLEAGDTRIKLRGMQGRQGDDKTGATVGLVVAFGLVGFMKHGKQAEVKEGTPLKAYVDHDTEIPVSTAVATSASTGSQEK